MPRSRNRQKWLFSRKIFENQDIIEQIVLQLNSKSLLAFCALNKFLSKILVHRNCEISIKNISMKWSYELIKIPFSEKLLKTIAHSIQTNDVELILFFVHYVPCHGTQITFDKFFQ